VLRCELCGVCGVGSDSGAGIGVGAALEFRPHSGRGLCLGLVFSFVELCLGREP
jgi:hypothetical protein